MSFMISRFLLAIRRTAVFSCIMAASLLTSAQSGIAQDGVNEEKAISGNNATIVVNVRSSSGDPLPVAAVVKLFRSGRIPNGQTTVSPGGRAIFMPQNLGDFSVVVEATGYKTGRANVDVPIPVKAEVDVYLQPEGDANTNPSAPGAPLLAPKAQQELDKGLAALKEKRLDEAETHLTAAQKLAPGHPDVLYLLGVLFLQKSEWVHAQTVLEKATQIDPRHARALAALGTVFADQSKYEEAIPPLEKSLELNPQSWETRWTLAKACYYQKQYDRALKESQSALTASAGRAPEIELLVAQALTSVGRYEESAQALRNFLQNHPDNAQVPLARRWLDRLTQAGKVHNE